MLWMWMSLGALAQTPGMVPTCERVSLADVADVTAPAVIVLGERKGVWPDLIRAERLVRKLKATGPVTLAIEAVRAEQQPVIDQLSAGTIGLADVPGLTNWTQTWGAPYEGYTGLFDLSRDGVKVRAIGVPVQLRPDDAVVPLPPAYLHILLDAVGEHAVPVDLEPTFLQTMAWRDHRLAANAIEAWDGNGVLVILADRLHVEGGKGVSWQAQQLTEHPVGAALLADARTPCYAGDRIWQDYPFQPPPKPRQ